jgi:hypothetical protein
VISSAGTRVTGQLGDDRGPFVREPRGRFKLTPQSCKLPVEAVEHRLPRLATTVNASRSRTCLRRLYHFDRLIPSTSDGHCAGASRLYPMRAPPALGPQPCLLALFRCQCHFLQVPKDGRLDWQTNKRQVVSRPSLLLMAFTNIRRVAAPLPPRRLDGRLGYEPVFRATAVATKPLRSDWS